MSAYFEPSLRNLMPNPSSMTGMDEATKLFCEAVSSGRRIAILGDYDVDGATSTATLLRYLRLIGTTDAIFHIPQRLTEGYGPNIPAVESLYEQGARLLMIVDSGTTAFGPIERAVELGMNVIVLDHHEPPPDGILPPAVIVNPKRTEDDGSLSYLCTAGLAMMFLVSVNRYLRAENFFDERGVNEPALQNLMGLTALGTVADLVPLIGLNRAFVTLGLSRMSSIPGIQALSDARQETEFSEKTCGFVFGPCINAGGRISDTRQGSLLLSTDDLDEAKTIAERLVALNNERKDMQTAMTDACIDSLSKTELSDVIVVHNEEWHPGVVGLVASRILDQFDRSAVVIGAGGKGSGRAVGGFNIGQAFMSAVEKGFLIKGGGHAAAGGLTLQPGMLEAFSHHMNEAAEGCERPPATVDVAWSIRDLSLDVVEGFEYMAPFGMGNEKPRIAVVDGIIQGIRILKEAHISGFLVLPDGSARVKFILFYAVRTPLGDAICNAEGNFADMMGQLSLNTYNGVTSVQLVPTDVMIGGKATASY
ncbi:single-stranded-DNA-specific exonuclease RecJ [Thalassospira xiamenensis]|nr:DHH family phosphoesterase [Thalassospira xiamenensis]